MSKQVIETIKNRLTPEEIKEFGEAMLASDYSRNYNLSIDNQSLLYLMRNKVRFGIHDKYIKRFTSEELNLTIKLDEL